MPGPSTPAVQNQEQYASRPGTLGSALQDFPQAKPPCTQREKVSRGSILSTGTRGSCHHSLPTSPGLWSAPGPRHRWRPTACHKLAHSTYLMHYMIFSGGCMFLLLGLNLFLRKEDTIVRGGGQGVDFECRHQWFDYFAAASR